ncbi:MAG: hypothetical protein Ct9H300mP1_08080 [Planctomycetaceae bacterium]|nr:MAG: hypothetical protein Ct9H300mP1_08080 [Planctomycetaceae bacterium]
MVETTTGAETTETTEEVVTEEAWPRRPQTNPEPQSISLEQPPRGSSRGGQQQRTRQQAMKKRLTGVVTSDKGDKTLRVEMSGGIAMRCTGRSSADGPSVTCTTKATWLMRGRGGDHRVPPRPRPSVGLVQVVESAAEAAG